MTTDEVSTWGRRGMKMEMEEKFGEMMEMMGMMGMMEMMEMEEMEAETSGLDFWRFFRAADFGETVGEMGMGARLHISPQETHRPRRNSVLVSAAFAMKAHNVGPRGSGREGISGWPAVEKTHHVNEK